jgi:hypothetical protein
MRRWGDRQHKGGEGFEETPNGDEDIFVDKEAAAVCVFGSLDQTVCASGQDLKVVTLLQKLEDSVQTA